MKLRELFDYLNHIPASVREKILDQELTVKLDERSIGPSAKTVVVKFGSGFDWDNKYFILYTKDDIIRGNNLRKNNENKTKEN